MNDEVLLAAILLAAAAVLLMLTIILLCLMFKTAKRRRSTLKGSSSEIPTSKTNNQHHNYALESDTNVGFYGNTETNQGTKISYYSNDAVDDHKAEWPKSYNMYAVRRSYAFPKAGEQNSEVLSETKPEPAPSVIASSTTGSITVRHEVQHKSFSEEVFEGISYTNSATMPRESDTASQTSSTNKIWKYRTTSETASMHSQDIDSVQGGAVSQSRAANQPSYYSSFKPHSASTSSQNSSQVTDISHGKNKVLTREKVATHSVTTTGNKKVFTFDLK